MFFELSEGGVGGGGGAREVKLGSAEPLNFQHLRATCFRIEIILDWCTEHLLFRGSLEPPSAKLFFKRRER